MANDYSVLMSDEYGWPAVPMPPLIARLNPSGMTLVVTFAAIAFFELIFKERTFAFSQLLGALSGIIGLLYFTWALHARAHYAALYSYRLNISMAVEMKLFQKKSYETWSAIIENGTYAHPSTSSVFHNYLH